MFSGLTKITRHHKKYLLAGKKVNEKEQTVSRFLIGLKTARKMFLNCTYCSSTVDVFMYLLTVLCTVSLLFISVESVFCFVRVTGWWQAKNVVYV